MKREHRKKKWKKAGHIEAHLQDLRYVNKEQGARDEKAEEKQ